MSTHGSRHSGTTIRRLLEMKKSGEKIVALTAYDFLFARILDDVGVDIILVGDSLGRVVLGHRSTRSVTLDDMIHHARAVRRGVRGALLVVDMPFLTYGISVEETVRNAGRVLRETGADGVKIEGGSDRACTHVERLVEAGIPVMGHLGAASPSTDPSDGSTAAEREGSDVARIRDEATRLAEAGAFGIVLERLTAGLAADITRASPVPTIGIGAGPEADGQVLVLYDMLGLNEAAAPDFLRRFADLAGEARRGVTDYVSAVRRGEYPTPAGR